MWEKQEIIAVEYAGFWVRLGAQIIDLIILSIIGWIICFIILSLVSGDLNAEDYANFRGSLVIVVGFILVVTYCIAFWVWRGQTPGKIAVGIKIIRTDTASIGLGRSILRYIGYIISGLIFMIGYLWIAFDSRKQGIHDKIADTYVIKLPKRKVILL